MHVLHLTTVTLGGAALFANRALAEWTWRHLRLLWPDALAAVLMGNHLHLAVPRVDGGLEAHRLAALLAQHAVLLGESGPLWKAPPPPKVITSVSKLLAELAYIWLNPCRAGLVDDPLRWGWSTYRDVFGAIADPWTPEARLAGTLHGRWRGPDALHAFVSADKHVTPFGTAPPAELEPTDKADVPLGYIAEAAIAATRGAPGDLVRRTRTRRAFQLLARDRGWDDARLLANVCGITPHAVRRTWRLEHPDDRALLLASQRCLADERLRAPRFPTWRGGDEDDAQLSVRSA